MTTANDRTISNNDTVATLAATDKIATSAGSITRSNFENSLSPAGWINVTAPEHGADKTGATSSVAGFQSAVDATANSGIQIFVVPAGTYAGDLSTLTIGSRTVVWFHLGNVTYSGGNPPGNRIFSPASGDTTRPWIIGKNGIFDSNTDGSSTDRPALRIQRTATHTGGTTGGSINSSALSVETQVGANVQNYETAIASQITSSLAQTVQTPNLTAVLGVTFKQAISTGGFFGGNFVGRDETTRQSSVSLGGLVGCEIGVVASGPDDSNLRIACEVIARGYDNSADGATSVYAGVRVRPSNVGVVTSEPVSLENAVLVAEGTLGSVVNCFAADGGATGLRLTGSYTNQAIEIRTESQNGTLRVGSDISTNSSTIGVLSFTGDNSAAEKTVFGLMRGVIVDNTDGSEDGRIDHRIPIAGTETTVLQLSGATGANPVSLRVNSSLKQVTEGATDSGGSGFKVLRVPN